MPETDFLFARPSFIEGLSRIYDFGNTLQEYNRSINGEEADKNAICNDFKMVGKDIEGAIERYGKEKEI